MKLSDREHVLIAYALNAALANLDVGVDDRAAIVFSAVAIMRAYEGELEDLSNYSIAAEELRRVGEEAEVALKGFKSELFKVVSDA